MYKEIIKDLENLKNPDKAKILSRFFKTWKWGYWEWDKFLWIPVPPQREVAKKYFEKCSLDDIEKLLKSEYHEILWNYLLDKDRNILYELAKDKNMWKQRVAIVSTMTFVKNWEFEDTLKISEMLLNHKHDLIHKAVGWLLREVWKKDE